MKKLRKKWEKQIAKDMGGNPSNLREAKRIARQYMKAGTVTKNPSGQAIFDQAYESGIPHRVYEKEGTIINALKGNQSAQSAVDWNAIQRVGSRTNSEFKDGDLVDRIFEKFRKIDEKNKKIKNLKTAGKVALGTAAAAGLAYGGKKAYDHYKNKKKQKE